MLVTSFAWPLGAAFLACRRQNLEIKTGVWYNDAEREREKERMRESEGVNHAQE